MKTHLLHSLAAVLFRPQQYKPAFQRGNRGERLVFLLLFLLALQPRAGDVALEKNVRRWLAMRREIIRQKKDWQQEQQALDERLAMLQQRQKVAKQRLAADEKKRLATAAKLRRQQKKLATSQQSLNALRPAIQAIKDKIDKWQKQLPPVDQNKLKSTRLPPGDHPNSPAVSIQQLLSQLTLLEQSCGKIRTARLLLSTPDGETVEMQTLLLGWTARYAVSADESRAAFAFFQGGNWVWQWDSRLARPIRQALDCANRKRPPTLTRLPLQINRETKP